MKSRIWKPVAGVAVVAVVAIATSVVVARDRKPGQLDVVTAQAMDMSSMRPPAGSAPVELATARRGSLGDTVVYTGSIAAYNQQDISPRITGTILSIPVYPGDRVRAGQLLVQLDSDEVRARQAEAAANADQARSAEQAQNLTSRVHHHAAYEQAEAQQAAAQAQVADAAAQLEAAKNGVGDAHAAVKSAQASDDYWTAEIAREKSLLDQGAVSRQEYESELSQAQAASASLSQANIKVQEAAAIEESARAKLNAARNQVSAAAAGVSMAGADMSVGEAQTVQAVDAARAAAASEREASVIAGYTRIGAPASGVVTARPVAPGVLVQPGTVVLTIAQIDRVRVQAHVAVNDLAGIRPGSPVSIAVPGVAAHIAASVSSVFPAANDETRTAVVEAVVANPGQKLLPGAFVSMRITKSVAHDRLLVPASAVVSDGGSAYIWVARGGQGDAGAGAMYECSICHMRYSAAQAKQYNYRDPMDGGKLVPVASSQSGSSGLIAHRVDVQPGAGDGTWTEVAAAGLDAGERVVVHGQAGLTENASVAPVAWGSDGPVSLPQPGAASGAAVYRCSKCGMTYSAADAAKYHYADPMDGGKLVKVKSPESMPGMKM